MVDGTAGTVELPDVREIEVVTCFLRHGEDILVLKRSDKVGTFQRHWAGVSGHIEDGDTAQETALKEIREELSIDDPELIASAPTMRVRDGNVIWTIHPFLFQARERQVQLDWEHTEHKWVRPEQLDELGTVPGLDRGPPLSDQLIPIYSPPAEVMRAGVEGSCLSTGRLDP